MGWDSALSFRALEHGCWCGPLLTLRLQVPFCITQSSAEPIVGQEGVLPTSHG